MVPKDVYIAIVGGGKKARKGTRLNSVQNSRSAAANKRAYHLNCLSLIKPNTPTLRLAIGAMYGVWKQFDRIASLQSVPLSLTQFSGFKNVEIFLALTLVARTLHFCTVA